MTRKSIYLSKTNDAALQAAFGADAGMCDDGKLNYSRAVNAALDAWQQSAAPQHCTICCGSGWPTAAADAGMHAYCHCKAGKLRELADLQAQTGQITGRIAQLKQELSN